MSHLSRLSILMALAAILVGGCLGGGDGLRMYRAGETIIPVESSEVTLGPLRDDNRDRYVGHAETQDYVVVVLRNSNGLYTVVAPREPLPSSAEESVNPYDLFAESEIAAMEVAILTALAEQKRGGAGEVPMTVFVPRYAASGFIRPTTRPSTQPATQPA